MPVGQLIRLTAKPEFRERLLELQRANVAGSRAEPGCIRFDMGADEADPNVLYIWEVFRDRDALDAHWRMPHFLAWRAWADSLPEGAVVRGRIGLLPLTP